MIKVDFHTHSFASPDGGLTLAHYQQLFDENVLDFIAITDHNTIEGAVAIKKELGKHIIIGEEINTQEGEVIGLFLHEAIAPHKTALQTMQLIHEQGGVVYLPHPFETVRKGLSMEVANRLAKHIDIVEVYNGRAWLQNTAQQARQWVAKQQVVIAASSDAHGPKGIGRTYTMLETAPTAQSVVKQLQTAHLTFKRPSARSILDPSYHRLLKKYKKGTKNV